MCYKDALKSLETHLCRNYIMCAADRPNKTNISNLFNKIQRVKIVNSKAILYISNFLVNVDK